MKKICFVLLACCVLGFIVYGCSPSDPISMPDPSSSLASIAPQIVPPPTSSTSLPSGPAGSINMYTAVEAFLAQYPAAELVEISYEYDDGIYSYEITGMDEASLYKIKLDADTGSVLHSYTKALQPQELRSRPYRVFTIDGIIDPDAAISAAADVEAGTFDEWSLENENGVLVYEVSFDTASGDDYKVIIDAKTGKVLSFDD